MFSGSFVDKCRAVKTLSRPVCSQLRSNNMMLCFLVSAHTGDKRPFYNLVSAMFGTFLCFYLADFTVLNGPQV